MGVGEIWREKIKRREDQETRRRRQLEVDKTNETRRNKVVNGITIGDNKTEYIHIPRTKGVTCRLCCAK